MNVRTTFRRAGRPAPAAIPGHAAGPLDPGLWASLLGMPAPSHLPATVRNVYGLPAVSAAVDRVANAVSQMLNGADVYDGAQQVAARPDVVARPNWSYRRSEFWRELVSGVLLDGNWIGLPVDADDAGYARQVVPVPISAVTASYDEFGFLVYDINGGAYSAAEVLHVRYGLTRPGEPFALGKVQAARLTFEGMLSAQQMSRSVYSDAAIPSGIVTIDTDVPSKDEREYVEDAWSARYGSGKRVPAVMGKKMSFQPLSWSPRDAEFVEGKQLSTAEAALLFGLRPSDLDAAIGGSSLTYGNRTDDALQRIVDAYQPIASVIEDAWSDLLPAGQTVVANPEALLRASTRERYELHGLAISSGWMTTDEVREIEGLEAGASD